MDKKAIYSLSYGVFMLATKSGEKVNQTIFHNFAPLIFKTKNR